MYLFQGGLDQTPSAFVGQDFDNFLAASPENNNEDTGSVGFMNPSDLTIKRERTDPGPTTGNLLRSSRSSASSSSSSASAQYEARNVSSASSSAATTKAQNTQAWNSGINGLSMPTTDQYYGDSSMSGLDQDFEDSNQQMASAFDFDTAASTPSGFDAASMVTMKPNPAINPFKRSATMTNFSNIKSSASQMAARQPQFFLGSREASPLSAMLPSTTNHSPWTKNSPSSGLEETFNHITMNGDSPGNATLSPNMQFNANGFPFDNDLSGTPSSFNKDMTSPPSTIHSGDGNPHLTIYPTSLKSRVETQIPIKMILFPLPPNVKKLRLPTHTVSKPKFLAKPEVERSPEVYELSTSLVCTSAMQDPLRRERALARARGEDLSPYTRPSPASSSGSHNSSRDDDEKPLNGGEVRICTGCIQRERKRASRKKQKKPDEEELFQKDEEKRVVVFNTSEIKDWVEVTKENHSSADGVPLPPAGAMQVELPMRIACYCRHQNEKMGFQVIFTIKDFREKVVAQAMTNSIMITDDHKTHNAPAPTQTNNVSQLPSAPQLPGAGVFSTSGMELSNAASNGNKMFKQSFSTTDLHGLQHNFNPNYPMTPISNPFAVPAPISAVTSGTMTPRNLSRPASPSGLTGPTSKRRKQSGSGKLPTGLTMTRLDTSQMTPGGAATVPNTAAHSPFVPHMPLFVSPGDRSYQMSNRPQPPFSTSPPTPNGNDGNFPVNINRSFSLENIPRQAMMSAPPSRQPSRPNSPRQASSRNSFGANDPQFGQAVNNGLMGHPSRRPTPIIHKLVPAEGSVTGGTEVTLLGNGFYQGLEVMFGDTEATTTTFWGEKCLNCIAPPALTPGVVAVMFKHEHPQYSAMQQQSQTRHSVFTYIDDREVEILRLALKTLGRQMQHPTDDPYSAAQQLLQQTQQQQQQHQQQGMWPQQGGYSLSGTGHQRQTSGMIPSDTVRLESTMLNMLHYAKTQSARNVIELDLSRPSGLTLLHLASSMGMSQFVAALISAGANPNQADNLGHTPMHLAAMHGHEQIIGRLCLAGADHRIRSLKNFIPADLATTLASHQATLRPYRHHQSRSAGNSSTLIHQRDISSGSLNSFWNYDADSHDEADSDTSNSTAEESIASQPLRSPFAQPESVTAASSRALSRRNSGQLNLPHSGQLGCDEYYQHSNTGTTNDSALMHAWRQLINTTHLQQQQLAEQIQRFQQNAHWGMPQENSLMRRMSTFLALRGDSNDASDATRDGPPPPLSPAPPAYEELYPGAPEYEGDLSLKKSSAIQAAADAAVDRHYEKYDSNVELDDRLNTTNGIMRPSVARVELRKDKKLFFFWVSYSQGSAPIDTNFSQIPLLAIVLALMIKNMGIMQVATALSEKFNGVIHRQGVEVM